MQVAKFFNLKYICKICICLCLPLCCIPVGLLKVQRSLLLPWNDLRNIITLDLDLVNGGWKIISCHFISTINSLRIFNLQKHCTKMAYRKCSEKYSRDHMSYILFCIAYFVYYFVCILYTLFI